MCIEPTHAFAPRGQVFRQADREGLVLQRANTISGFKGVKKVTAGSRTRSKHSASHPFRAKGSRAANDGLGYYATAAEAALAYARHQETKDMAQVRDAAEHMHPCACVPPYVHMHIQSTRIAWTGVRRGRPPPWDARPQRQVAS